MSNKDRKPFIVFEGLDGSGLTTHAFDLHRWLKERGYEVYLTKEPTDGVLGGLIRSALKGELKVSARTLALLFAADRTQHTETIKRLINSGVVVISDRYKLSSYAYQSIEVDLDWLRKINEGALTPDVTFVIDVPPAVCMRRLQKERFHTELYEDMETLERVRENYRRLAEEEENVIIIDGNRPQDVVNREIFQKIKELELLEGL
ncbi:MAG: Thymidylate kinase [Candidatus Alkanophagales archaeon MCA70_species_1]|nr:Thymidylate kinase [Candidatus Alkanophaga volatiphilum]